MIIQSLELTDFRNYQNVQVSFDSGTNVLFGDNAQGKTNILEAIYLCATTKSHKGSKDKEIVNFDSEEGHIRAEVYKKELVEQIDMHLRKNKTKIIAINGRKISKAAELLGLINVVFFSPEDLCIVKNGPSERRRFVDMELCQLDSFYLYNLSSYNKIINQRNILLKDLYSHSELRDTLHIWDSQLLNYGSKVMERRRLFTEQMNEILEEIHYKLSGSKEKLVMEYLPQVSEENFEEELRNSQERDIRMKQSSVGPHRDDFIFCINGIDVRRFGSQGQQRTVALSLKLAEIELVKRVTKENPVLLLDDVLSELDSNRQKYLLESIGSIQTIITCTGLDEFVQNNFQINKLLKVVNGTIIDDN